MFPVWWGSWSLESLKQNVGGFAFLQSAAWLPQGDWIGRSKTGGEGSREEVCWTLLTASPVMTFRAHRSLILLRRLNVQVWIQANHRHCHFLLPVVGPGVCLWSSSFWPVELGRRCLESFPLMKIAGEKAFFVPFPPSYIWGYDGWSCGNHIDTMRHKPEAEKPTQQRWQHRKMARAR